VVRVSNKVWIWTKSLWKFELQDYLRFNPSITKFSNQVIQGRNWLDIIEPCLRVYDESLSWSGTEQFYNYSSDHSMLSCVLLDCKGPLQWSIRNMNVTQKNWKYWMAVRTFSGNYNYGPEYEVQSTLPRGNALNNSASGFPRGNALNNRKLDGAAEPKSTSRCVQQLLGPLIWPLITQIKNWSFSTAIYFFPIIAEPDPKQIVEGR
jgi:hypothetical protein